MRVCIDTNVVLGMFTLGHPYRPIFEAWFDGKLHWAVTTEILFEYEEVTQRQAGTRKAAMMMRLIALVDSQHANLISVSPTFRFRTITHDPDDDKFADCAIATEADYIITEDRHFRTLATAGYQPQPITPEEFIQRHLP